MNSLTHHVFSSFCYVLQGKGDKEGVIKAYSNLDDESEDDETYRFSALSIEDEQLIYDDDDDLNMGKSVTFSTAGHSQKNISARNVAMSRVANRVHGATFGSSKSSGIVTALPYLIDYWHDLSLSKRASIQIHMLSGNAEMLNRVTYRVSSCQREFVITTPISPFLSCEQKGLHALALHGIPEKDKPKHTAVLMYHAKPAARRIQLQSIKNVTSTGLTVMEFRIPLAFKCKFEFAPKANDPYFHEFKFTAYPDGSTHLHVELVADDGSVPAEPRNGGARII